MGKGTDIPKTVPATPTPPPSSLAFMARTPPLFPKRDASLRVLRRRVEARKGGDRWRGEGSEGRPGSQGRNSPFLAISSSKSINLLPKPKEE